MLFLLLCFLPVEVWSVPTTPPTTEVHQGRLSGLWWTTREGRTVAGFLGVPFAEPPVGELRFENPRPARPWSGVYSAVKDAPGCVQNVSTLPNFPDNPTETSEDCLYLNVFTPNLNPRKKLPVLVFIYGGAFERASSVSSAYGPQYLLDEDVVLVAMNYRLGILGFLSLEDPILPGNLGLKDQREALRWVRANIAEFGGDPHLVTIWGQSSGGACVHLHLQTTYHEGLFRAIIADSASSRSPFSFGRPGSQISNVNKLANLTGCPRGSSELVNCLRKIPVQNFVPLLEQIRDTGLSIKSHSPVFPPMMEPDCAQDVILTADPWTTITNIPILQGANDYEGLLSLVAYDKDKTNKLFEEVNEYYKTVIPYNQFIDETAQDPRAVGERLKEFYFGDSNIDRYHYINFVDLTSDARYKYPLVVAARANKGNTYFYQLAYKGVNTIVRYEGDSNYFGVSHYDEMFYFFPVGGFNIRNLTLQDTKLSQQMVKMWTNFVKYLEPAPLGHPTRWTPVVTPSIEYLDIGQYGFSMQCNFQKPRMDFWDWLPFRNKPEAGRPLCLSSTRLS